MAVDWIKNIQTNCPGKMVNSPGSAVLLGLIKNDYKFTQLEDLKSCTQNGYILIFIQLNTYCFLIRSYKI